jgi:hypothetical protein
MSKFREEYRERCRQLDRELVARARESFARFTSAQQRSIAEHIVERALATHGRKLHLSLMFDHCGGRELPAVPYHWKYKNIVGVSFARNEAKPAGRRASFSHGSVGGYLGYVPHEAGVEAMQVIRHYYAAALDTLQRTT